MSGSSVAQLLGWAANSRDSAIVGMFSCILRIKNVKFLLLIYGYAIANLMMNIPHAPLSNLTNSHVSTLGSADSAVACPH